MRALAAIEACAAVPMQKDDGSTGSLPVNVTALQFSDGSCASGQSWDKASKELVMALVVSHLAYKPCPTIEDRQNTFPLFGIEADDAATDAKLLGTHQCPDLIRSESVELFGIEANCDRA
jgi:hypothetical protein